MWLVSGKVCGLYCALPIEKGDAINQARASEAVRALFKTGFFNAANWLAPPYGKRAKRLLRFLMR